MVNEMHAAKSASRRGSASALLWFTIDHIHRAQYPEEDPTPTVDQAKRRVRKRKRKVPEADDVLGDQEYENQTVFITTF